MNMNVDILNRSPLSKADIDTTILEFKTIDRYAMDVVGRKRMTGKKISC